jgi:hypothetical protein
MISSCQQWEVTSSEKGEKFYHPCVSAKSVRRKWYELRKGHNSGEKRMEYKDIWQSESKDTQARHWRHWQVLMVGQLCKDGHEKHLEWPWISGSRSWVCGSTITKEEVHQVGRVVNSTLGIPSQWCLGSIQWAARNTALVYTNWSWL